MPDNGFDVLSTIFRDPVKPSELKRDVDPAKVKEALGDHFDDGSSDAKKKEEEDEKEFTKEFEKKDEPAGTDKNDPEAVKPKEDIVKEAVIPDGKTDDSKKEDDDETEAKGKIKNIGDARKLYKEHKKLLKEYNSLKSSRLHQSRTRKPLPFRRKSWPNSAPKRNISKRSSRRLSARPMPLQFRIQNPSNA